MFKKPVLAEAGSPSSKAAAILARGAYFQYVSTAQWRERRWRLFSTFPNKKNVVTLWMMRHFLFCEVRQELVWIFVIPLRFLG